MCYSSYTSISPNPLAARIMTGQPIALFYPVLPCIPTPLPSHSSPSFPSSFSLQFISTSNESLRHVTAALGIVPAEVRRALIGPRPPQKITSRLPFSLSLLNTPKSIVSPRLYHISTSRLNLQLRLTRKNPLCTCPRCHRLLRYSPLLLAA